jgi:hypothetical protein
MFMLVNSASTQQVPESIVNESQLYVEEVANIWADPRAQIDRRQRVDINNIPSNGCRRTYDRRVLQYRHTEQWWLQRDYDNVALSNTVIKIDLNDNIFQWLDSQKSG